MTNILSTIFNLHWNHIQNSDNKLISEKNKQLPTGNLINEQKNICSKFSIYTTDIQH